MSKPRKPKKRLRNGQSRDGLIKWREMPDGSRLFTVYGKFAKGIERDCAWLGISHSEWEVKFNEFFTEFLIERAKQRGLRIPKSLLAAKPKPKRRRKPTSKRDRSAAAVLQLNLHREYFAAIAVGTKRIEYRDRTPYWKTRLEGRRYDLVCFRNGYATNAPEMWVEWLGVRRYGTARRGHNAIRLGRIVKIKRWRQP
jgi:hypothetical protein